MEIEIIRAYIRLGQYNAFNAITEMYPTGHPVRRALLVDDKDRIMEKLNEELNRLYPMPIPEPEMVEVEL